MVVLYLLGVLENSFARLSTLRNLSC
uniref:Uncharacterized protein n=1 Tax=Rhizophora mucronata TaxID=61149 RepID=A0A2P2JL56_RHIMU